MSIEYDEYLSEHIANVQRGLNWMRDNLKVNGLIDERAMDIACENAMIHDSTKTSSEEYPAYDAYFYGGNRSYKVCQDFDYAWLHHQKLNPHHWQYWILIKDKPNNIDDPFDTELPKMPILKPMLIPLEYVYEMIADWWTFSWKNGNLFEIFKWYNINSPYILMHDGTKAVVNNILQEMYKILIMQETIAGHDITDIEKQYMLYFMHKPEPKSFVEHSGVQGMHWGERNGPPYPLNSSKVAEKIFKDAKAKSEKITNDVENAAKRSGGKLHGLENQLKTVDSIERKLNKKINEKGMDITEAANDIKDAVRYTVVAPADNFVNMYYDFKADMSKKGYEETSCDNYFDKFNKGEVKHKAVQSNFADEDGYEFEVQFHTPESQDAKDKKLPLYNERRKTGISDQRARELEQQMEKLAKNVPDPSNIGDIPSYKTSFSKYTKDQLSNEVQRLKKELKTLRSDKSTDPEYIELVEMELEETQKSLNLKHSESEDDEGLYGIPELKKYPMPNKEHVKSAIRFFNYVDPKHEKELAEAIIEKAEKFGLDLENDISVGDENRFKKYLKKEES